jgi:Ca2+-binding RTX toxin-like protein
MNGGTGDDTYVVDNVGDTTVELTGEGVDRVLTSVSFTLANNVENLTLVGSASINGTGNGLDNYLKGNGGANTLNGGGGNDTLTGDAGADAMYGGAGHDLYYVDNAGDVVVENASEGTDKVMSSVTFALSANVENLTLTGASAINGTGNGLANVLTGNSAANTLDGGAGDDRLEGGAGADTLTGGSGADAFVFRGLPDSSVAAPDHITDFVSGTDHIDLAAIDANTGLAGDQAFAFVGAFDSHAGEAVLAYDAGSDVTTLTLDVNGDAAADFKLLINGHVLADGGFIL